MFGSFVLQLLFYRINRDCSSANSDTAETIRIALCYYFSLCCDIINLGDNMNNDNASLREFEEIYDIYKKKIYNLAYRMLGNEQDAQDIMQDTFCLALKNYDKFRNESNIYTWLYRICTNECLRQRKKHSIKFTELLDDKFEYTVDSKHKEWIENPENAAQIMELTNYIRSECHHIVLQTLTEEQRIVYIMRVIMEMSYQHIAQSLDISENVVKARLNRARNKLLNHFEKNCNWFKNQNDKCCSKKLGYALSQDVEILNRLDEMTLDYYNTPKTDDKKDFIDYIYMNLPLLELNN